MPGGQPRRESRQEHRTDPGSETGGDPAGGSDDLGADTGRDYGGDLGRLDPDRRRRRVRLLAEIAEAHALGDPPNLRRARLERLRMIVQRRRPSL